MAKPNRQPINRRSPVFQSGFTLVELVVTILLVGILAFVAAPRFFQTSGFTERNAAEELVTAFRYAQQLAMARGGDVQVVITGNHYQVQAVGPPVVVVANPNGSGTYSVNLPGGISAGSVTITFDSLGRPLPNNRTDISIAGGAFTVRIEEETGYAHRL
ncbi:MAG: GspH/FimT family pseudopilin [Gammaproteobacteria bacterium]